MNSNKVYEITVETETPFNISTGNKNSGFVKNLTVRDSEGKPYIPGSTMKGLIKDKYRILENNVEDIFGKEGDSISKIIVDDLKIENEVESTTNIRFGNAIDRYRGTARENSLYSKEVVSGIFKGKIYICDCDEILDRNIRVAVQMITAIGGGKNTGFGQVKVSIEPPSGNKIEDKSLKHDKLKQSNKFALNFESLLLIGGRKRSSNFIETDDVIKGSVVRAAFAKVILENCKLMNNDTEYDNWITYDENEQETKLKNIRKNFSKIRFSYFYPESSEIAPLSSKKCKNDDEHGFIDELIDTDEDQEKVGKCRRCGSRLESAKGLRTITKNDSDKRPYKVQKGIVTKNAINPYTKTSADKMLYSVETITGVQGVNFKDENSKEDTSGNEDSKSEKYFRYVGFIEGLENIPEEELNYFSELRIGGDTTVGLGKCTLESIGEEDDTKTENNLVKSFTEVHSKVRKDKFFEEDDDKDKKYIAIKFNSDCKLNFNYKSEYINTADLKKRWKEALWENIEFKNSQEEIALKDKIEVERVYAEFINYRGYSRSIKGLDKRDEMVNFVSKGTVVVFSAKTSENELFEYFKSIKGFGGEQENGFGDFEIYFGGLEDDKQR